MNNLLTVRQSSQIQRVVRDGAVVFEKQYVTTDWDDDIALIRQRAQREVDILSRIDDSDLFGGRLGVVRIEKADPDAATIATYEIAGMSLGDFILQSKEVRTNLMPWFLAGRWLRQFHELKLADYSTEVISRRDPKDIVDYCDLRLRTLTELGYSWPNETIRKTLLQTIEGLRDRCDDVDTTQVWVHADYAPGNLMWNGQVLTPIDFAMIRKGPPLNDATYLIHRIEMQKVYRPWLRLPVAAIRRAILQGLDRPTAQQSAAYQMLMIKHNICRLLTYVHRPANSLKQSLHDRWVRMCLRRNLLAMEYRSRSRK